MAFKILIENKASLASYRLGRRPAEEDIFEDFSEAIRSLKKDDELLIMPGRYYSASERDGIYRLEAEIRTPEIKGITIEGYVSASTEAADSNCSDTDVIIDGSIPDLSRRDAWVKSTEVANSVFSHEQIYVTREAYPLFGNLEMIGYVEIDCKQYALTNYGKALAAEIGGQVIVSQKACLKIKEQCFSSNEDHFWNRHGKFQNSYIGPGFWYDPESKKIYVRLDALSASVVGAERTIPMSFEDFFDPGLDRKLFFCPTGNSTIRIPQDRAVENLTVRNLKFRNQTRGVLSFQNAKNVEIDNCEFITNHAISIGQGSEEVIIKNCKFDGALPPWISWGDVKGTVIDSQRNVRLGDTSHTHNAEMVVFHPGSGSDTDDINNIKPYNRVINCHFTDCFDAIQVQADTYEKFKDGDRKGQMDPSTVRPGARNVYIHNNTFESVRDDCVYLGATCHHVIVSNNVMRGVGTGFAIVGGKDESLSLSEEDLGTIYIHHNLIECAPVYAGRIFCSESYPLDAPHFKRINQYAIQAFVTSHGGVGHNYAPRKIYNNTVILRGNTDEVSNLRSLDDKFKIPKISAQYPGARPVSRITEDRYRHEVYNNVFIQYSELYMIGSSNNDGMIPLLSDQAEFFDGNIYYRKLEDTSPKILIKVFREPDTEAVTYNDLAALQSDVSINWEANGKEGDPELESDFYPRPNGLAAETFVSLADKTYLPEAGRDSNFCGAFPPRLSRGCIPAWIARFMQSIVSS